MAVASTDYLQEVDVASTPKMAPTTPMQVLQKPQQTRESMNVFPSLTLGGCSESKGSFNKPMPARRAPADMSTPSKLQGGPQQDEIWGSFCLSKYEKKYHQTPGMGLHMYSHMGPLHSNAGHMSTTSRTHMAHLDTQSLSQGRLDKSQEASPTHTQVLQKGVLYAAGDPAARLSSPTPGEVALDAYELYSKMFPSTCTAAAEHSSPLTDDPDLGRYARSPSIEHMNNMQLLRSVSHGHKPSVWDVRERTDDLVDGERKIKFAKVKEEDTPGGGSTRGDAEPLQIPPESAAMVICAHNSGKVVQSGGFTGHAAGEEAMSTRPATGLKLCASTACMQMPKACPNEPSILLSMDPSASRGISKTPVQDGASADADWGRYLALSATPARSSAEFAIMRPFQERFKELQAFLRQCDEANQTDQSIQALKALSGAARSGYAVELETRAIRLSLEEGKEMKRMRLLNVLGKISDRNLDTAGVTPHGLRLPGPGVAATPNHVL